MVELRDCCIAEAIPTAVTMSTMPKAALSTRRKRLEDQISELESRAAGMRVPQVVGARSRPSAACSPISHVRIAPIQEITSLD